MAAPTPSQLAERMSQLIDKWNIYTDQLRAWLGGAATGGPYGDGRYPLTNSYGETFFIPCPAAEAERVDGVVGSAAFFSTLADASSVAASVAKVDSEVARGITLTYRDAAEVSKVLAETYMNTAGSHAANALAARDTAVAAAASVSVDAEALNAAISAADADRIAAEAARLAAEAAAAAAATYDPGNFYTKSVSDTRYAAAGHAHAFESLTSRPSTLSGYGINDALELSGGTLTGAITHQAGTLPNNSSWSVLKAYSDNVAGEASISYYRGAVSSRGGWDFNVASGAASNRLAVRLHETGVGDAFHGWRIFNSGQLKVYDSNGDTPLELGLGFANASDRNGYLWNRNNGLLSFGTNNASRGHIAATGDLRWHHEISTTNNNAFRMVSGNYGAFFRNDGSDLYLLLTNSGDQYGGWNALRPLTVNLATGRAGFGGIHFGTTIASSSSDVSRHIALYSTSYGLGITNARMNIVVGTGARHYFVNGASDAVSIGAPNISDTVSVAGGIRSAGANAVLHFRDRTTSRDWGWYASGDLVRLWSGSADILTLDSTGVVTANNSIATSGTGYYIQSKLAIQGTDSWMRLNPSGHFTSGIYSGAGQFRHDGNLNLSVGGYVTFGGGKRISQITVSTGAPTATMNNGELWFRY